MSVKIDELANAIAGALEEYSQDVTDDVKASVRGSAKACVSELKSTSPSLTGDYAEGWREKVAFEGPTDIRMQVYNATDYQITHLLEDGHAKVNGGRVPAYPHIGAAADNASELLEKDVTIRVGRR